MSDSLYWRNYENKIWNHLWNWKQTKIEYKILYYLYNYLGVDLNYPYNIPIWLEKEESKKRNGKNQRNRSREWNWKCAQWENEGVIFYQKTRKKKKPAPRTEPKSAGCPWNVPKPICSLEEPELNWSVLSSSGKNAHLCKWSEAYLDFLSSGWIEYKIFCGRELLKILKIYCITGRG